MERVGRCCSNVGHCAGPAVGVGQGSSRKGVVEAPGFMVKSAPSTADAVETEERGE